MTVGYPVTLGARPCRPTMGLALLSATAALLALAGCNPLGDEPPKHLPKQVKGNWGPNGKTCPRLDGEYQFLASDGNGFLPAGEGMYPPEFGQWSAVRLQSQSEGQYRVTRTMTRDDFLAAAMHLRDSAPDRYVHWRADMLYNAGKQRLDRTYANRDDRLKPWLTQDQQGLVHGLACEAGWMTMHRATRLIEKPSGLRASEFVQVDLTPDVEHGLLVRTTRCELKSAQIMNIEFCPGGATSFARMAPATWPEKWVANAGDLPMPVSAAAPAQEDRSLPRQPPTPAPEDRPPPAEMSRLATILFERLPDKLPAGTTLESIVATPEGVLLVLRSPSPGHVREVTNTLIADAGVGDVTPIGKVTAAGNALQYQLIVKPKQP